MPRDIVLTANFPRDGSVSYWLGWIEFMSKVAPRNETRRPAGTAWLVGETFVLAGSGCWPAIEDLEGAIGDLIR